MSRKIGFWSVFAIVTGSQIGSGVFMSPATLAPFGTFGLVGWLISGVGALSLAFVFASLCARVPKTGGPHAFVREAFGSAAAFWVGWTYWVVSFVSTTAVIVTSIGYLSPFLPGQSSSVYLALELVLLLAIVLLNLGGVSAAGRAEFVLTLLKFIPLLIMPAIALFYFESSNIVVDASVSSMGFGQMLGHVTLLTLWGFIGLESATAPAGSVENPSKTIPRAILLGTSTVAIIYMFSTLGIMGLMPGAALMNSKAPYVDAAQVLFSGNWHYAISIIASIVCVGTLNAWVLTSGQIALGLAEDKLLPKSFAKKNTKGAPSFGIIVSSLGIVPLLFLTSSNSFAAQVTSIIDISVISFLFVYVFCAVSLLRILNREKTRAYASYALCLVALGFCAFVILQTPLKTLLIASLFTLSGLPMYLAYRKGNLQN